MSTVQLNVNAPPSGTYAIDPRRSEIRFDTKHMFGTGKVAGKLSAVDGTIVVAAEPAATTVSAGVSARSFDSGNAKRDEKVKSAAFLHVEAHPRIEFTADHLKREGDEWHLDGTLTAHGQAAPMRLTISDVVADAAGLTVTAHGTVDRYAHGVTAMKGMAGRTLGLTITAYATRK